MSKKSKIDQELQKKYIKTIEQIFSQYFIPPREGFVADIGSALLLKNSSALLTGSPGVGKSTLLRLIAYELTGKPESLATVTCTEDLRPEDFIYDVDIHQRAQGPDLTTFEFRPLSRPLLTRTFAFINEVNRLNSRARNSLLSVLHEREIVVKGSRLERTDGIILMDMNPTYGALEWAFIDRVRAHIAVPALTLGDQLRLFRTKYGAGKHVEDLVAYAMRESAMMSEDELFRVWEDVDKVELPEAYASSILLFTNVFSSCRFPLSEVHSNFKLPCEESCQYSETCVTKMLEHPVLTRSIDHIVKALKAHAYFEGRTVVDLQSDVLPALKRVMVHRVAVKPEYASKYPTIEEWFAEEAEAKIVALQDNWKHAKVTYDAIAKALGDKKDAEAAETLNKFRAEAKDIVSVKLAEILEPDIEAASEERFKRAYAKAMAMVFSDYEESAIAQLRQEPFPAKYARELERVLRRLELYLTGVLQIDESEYKQLLSALVKIDPSIVRLTPFPQGWGEQEHEFPDKSKVTIRREYGSYVVKYACKTSQTARVFHDWRTQEQH